MMVTLDFGDDGKSVILKLSDLDLSDSSKSAIGGDDPPVGQPRKILTSSKRKKEKIKFPKVRRYTPDIFKERCWIVHGYSFDYSEVTLESIASTLTKFYITCRKCGYRFQCDIKSHLNKQAGCHQCMGKLKWTLQRFIEAARRIHGEYRYDYSMITENHISGKDSHVPIRCLECNFIWHPTIHVHINHKSNCPNCQGMARWTLPFFHSSARAVHGENRYDYSMITEDHIKNKDSCVPVRCLRCNLIWQPSIHDHINKKHGCWRCSGCLPWTFARVVEELRSMGDDKYDFSRIVEADINNGMKSRLNIVCRACGLNWFPTVKSFIVKRSGCKQCVPNGCSRAQIVYLEGLMATHGIRIQYALSPEGECKIPGVGRVDGYYKEMNLVIEFHGKYYHAYPALYPQDEPHPTIRGKTYGEVYRDTLARDQRIKDAGYNLLVKWENDVDLKYPMSI